jgi:glucose-6-phosphate isomerase
MPLENTDPTITNAWKKLKEHYSETASRTLKEMFAEDRDRAAKFSILWNTFLVDFSKQRISERTMSLLLDLAAEVQLKDGIRKYFEGDVINQTEKRAVLHTALRAPRELRLDVDGKDIIPEIFEVKARMRAFAEAIISGSKRGYTGKPITDVVNIGIGGSDLGPAMVTEALRFYGNHLRMHFVSNVDGDHLHETLKHLPVETTLFVIVSKTFTTQETLTNATTSKKWFLKHGSKKDIALHFAAVSTNTSKIDEFGISSEHVFPMWDWVGGRFSLWSAVGLSIALAVGFDHYEEMLEGARHMDEHFRNSPHDQNIPVVLALLSIWYNNFHGAETEAIIPYSQYLHRFSAYMQQGMMESNGKSIDRNGKRVTYDTGTILWGEPGTNSQHAFFQLIHQGTKLIPVDFIGFKRSLYGDTDHHLKLMANFFAQTEALMNGKTPDEVVAEMEAKGVAEAELKAVLPFRVFEGNRPSTTILIDQLTPASLGSLIAMYEHKIFVQGLIWNIYSFDQWGVELGKVLATVTLQDLQSSEISIHDSSTMQLLQHFKS